MEQTERRALGRVPYLSDGVVVVCDTQAVFHVGVLDVGPSGVSLTLPEDAPDLTGRDLILVMDTMIMYVDVIRQERRQDGAWRAGVAARKFSREVLQYLFDSIELKTKFEENEENRDET